MVLPSATPPPTPIQLSYRQRPSAWEYLLRAVAAGPSRRLAAPLPAVQASWTGCHLAATDIAAFSRLCGLAPVADRLPPLFLHAIAFRLQMAVVAHPGFPAPIWRVLQVRNQLLEHAPASAGAQLQFDCRPVARRVLLKGMEVDLHTLISADGQLVAQSVNTFYARGRFAAIGAAAEATPPAPMPDKPTLLARWRAPTRGGLRFARLTGDYNGLHLWDLYARTMGFRGAFLHPLHAVGQCLAQAGLQDPPYPRRFGVWLKGPVFHGAGLQLRGGSRDDAGTVLALQVDADPRPAVIVQLTTGAKSAMVAASAPA